MVLFLSECPRWLAALILIVFPTIVAMCGPILVRRRVGLDRLTTNNEIAGFKFATVGVIYAVLLAFAVIVRLGKVRGRRDCGHPGGRRLCYDLSPDGRSPNPTLSQFAALSPTISNWQLTRTGRKWPTKKKVQQ